MAQKWFHIRTTSAYLPSQKKSIYCTHLHFVTNALGFIRKKLFTPVPWLHLSESVLLFKQLEEGAMASTECTRQTFIHPFTLYPTQSIILLAIKGKASTALLITTVSDSHRPKVQK